MFHARNHPISQYCAAQDSAVLSDVFRDIYQYRNTGVVPDPGALLHFKAGLEPATGLRDLDLRLVEDAVLFEMARRYFNDEEGRAHEVV